MHEKDFAAVEMNQHILGPAGEALDRSARQTGREAFGKWAPKITARQADGGDAASAQRLLEATLDDFDFRQLRHRSAHRKGAEGPQWNRTRSSAKVRDGMGARDRTQFGFRQVAAAERQGLVNQVFATVAGRYDQMNDLMSLGLHRIWKDDFVTLLGVPRSPRPYNVLDVAGGTGDIAFRIANAGGPGTRVVVADISPEMVDVGMSRARQTPGGGRCRFSVANAEALPFPDRTFDAYTVAFGIRNVTRREEALEEAFRVLKPGGKFQCLEFSHVDVPVLDAIYETYSMTAIPAMGKAVTGEGAPYRYLVESIRTFPTQQQFAHLIEASGFERVGYRNLSGGIVAIHWGWRI